MVCLRLAGIRSSELQWCGERELLQVSQIALVVMSQTHACTPSSSRTHTLIVAEHSDPPCHRLRSSHTYHKHTHNGFTRTLDAGPPSGRRSLHSRHDPSQLPELSTLARSPGWSHACPQARGRLPWRVRNTSLSNPISLCIFRLLFLLYLLTSASFIRLPEPKRRRVTKTDIATYQYPRIPLWSYHQRRSSVLLCH